MLVQLDSLQIIHRKIKHEMKALKILLIISILYPDTGKSQDRPTARQPLPKENMVLVDSILSVTNYGEYFNDKCISGTREYATKNSWDEQKTRKIFSSIDLQNFKPVIYNFFSQIPIEELKSIIKLFEIINKTKGYLNFIITNAGIESELDFFIRTLIQGKYLK